MERSIEFNNAGVSCVEEGDHKAAWDLFKGALELKLAAERTSMNGGGDGPKQELPKNKYIEKAEAQYAKRKSHPKSLDHSPRSVTYLQDNCHPQRQELSRRQMEWAPDVLDSPFLFTHAMRLERDTDMSTRKQSATIIFNLAIVDHLKNRLSEQAVSLYELAMTLLAGDVVDLLGISLMNNMGVWCYENGDMDGAMACMAHLAGFMVSCSSIDQAQKDGIQSNIIWLTYPPSPASPAA